MVRDRLDPEHAMIWDKLEEIGKQPGKLIMYMLPLFLTLVGAIFAFSYGIGERLNDHLEAGGKLGARLEARSVATQASLTDKYDRHMGVHHQLNDDIRVLEKWLHGLERRTALLLDQSQGNGVPHPDSFIFPYGSEDKIPAIYKKETDE
jgi:hypothetical protein